MPKAIYQIMDNDWLMETLLVILTIIPVSHLLFYAELFDQNADIIVCRNLFLSTRMY